MANTSAYQGDPVMPSVPSFDIPTEEQAEMRAALRRARYGSLLPSHPIAVCHGTSATESAAVLCCPRSRVSRTVRAYQEGGLHWEDDAQGRLVPPVRTTVLLPTRRRARLALLQVPPRAYGGCRTRWSGATLALTLQGNRGLTGSAETRRRWRQEIGWVWQRAQLGAQEDDPPRVHRLARSRWVCEPHEPAEAIVVADAGSHFA